MEYYGLDIKGEMKMEEVSSNPAPHQASWERRLIYNTTNKRTYYSDGTQWIRIAEHSNLSDEKVKVSSNDTTANYLSNKLTAGSNITLTETNDGGNESYRIDAAGSTDELLKVSSNDTTANYLQSKIQAGSGIARSIAPEGGNEVMTISASNVGRSNLKTSYGTVGGSTGVYTLPGGQYGFYPLIKGLDCLASIGWGFAITESGYIAPTSYDPYTGGSTGGGYYTTTTIAGGYDLSSYTAVIKLYKNNGKSSNSYKPYALQRYITSSGEVFWIFLLRYKNDSEIKCVWSAPDHPCFGQGGDPTKVSHPFLMFDPSVHVINVWTPNADDLKELQTEKKNNNFSDFSETIIERYKVGGRAKLPDIPVTVGLETDNMEVGYPESDEIELKKMIIPETKHVKPVNMLKR